jgi:hypothetical protein
MYKLNQYGKIVVSDKEVYFGCVIDINTKIQIAKLLVVDWRDREQKPLSFEEMVVPLSKFSIKYLEVEE